MTNTKFFNQYCFLEKRIIHFLEYLNIKADSVYIHWVDSHCIKVFITTKKENKILPYTFSITPNGRFYILEEEMY